MFLRLFIVCALIPVMLSGCGLSKRDALMKEWYPTYPEKVRNAIDEGCIAYGMDMNQVYLSIGEPCCETVQYEGNRRLILWGYDQMMMKHISVDGPHSMCISHCYKTATRVYFENGAVVRWHNADSCNN